MKRRNPVGEVLTQNESDLVSSFKQEGKLKRFFRQDMVNVTKNGGIAFICGDGDVDIFDYHRKVVSDRPHAIKLFGGPLLLCNSFRKYDRSRTLSIFENIEWGMSAKMTKTFFLYFHYPCGVASKFKHSLKEVLGMAPEAASGIKAHFNPKNIFSFLQVKRVNKGEKIEQNTYII